MKILGTVAELPVEPAKREQFVEVWAAADLLPDGEWLEVECDDFSERIALRLEALTLNYPVRAVAGRVYVGRGRRGPGND